MSQRLKPHLIPLLLLLFMSVAVNGQTLGHDFLTNGDDHAYIIRYETVTGFSVKHPEMAFTSLYVGNHPPLGHHNLDAITRNHELDSLRRLSSFNRLLADFFPTGTRR